MQSHNYQSIFEGIRNIPVLPELSVPHTARFLVSTEEEVLYPLIEAHDIIIPSGAFFGDEGKGRAVKAIAQHPDVELVARLNSGENAGHTNFDEFMHKFVFNLATSGLIIPGKKNVIGPNCVMDPISFMEKEMQQLIDAGIEYLSRLTIGNVMIVTPYHKIMDALGKPNSSTMQGMSPVHTSKVTKKGLRLDHVFNSPDIQRARLQEDMEMYYGALHAKGMSETQVLEQLTELNKDLKRIPDHVINFLKAKNKIDYIIDLYEDGVKNNDNFPRRGDVTHIIQQTLESRKKVLIEPAQSFFLSNNVETHWSSSTSADTTAAGTLAAAGVNVSKYRVLFYNIHKTPAPSRVGLGSNPAGYVPQDYFSSQQINTLKDLEGICEDFDDIQRKFSEAIQENGVLNPIGQYLSY